MSKTLISLFLVVAFALVVACVDVTPDELKAILPNLATSKKASYAEYMNDAMDEGDIDSCCEIAAFIAQVGHESGMFCYSHLQFTDMQLFFSDMFR